MKYRVLARPKEKAIYAYVQNNISAAKAYDEYQL